MITPIIDALDVLGRRLSWLARDEHNLNDSRFVEETLTPWAVRLFAAGDAAAEPALVVRVALAGFDEADDRAERVQQMLAAVAQVAAIVGPVVPPERVARAELLPPGVASDVLPPAPRVELPPAPVLDLTGGAALEARPEREAPPSAEGRRPRGERPERPERPERGERSERGERGERQAEPQIGRAHV